MASKKLNEADLRDWLAKVWTASALGRVEAARGGDEGHPDAEIIVQHSLGSYIVPLPVKLELKVWWRGPRTITATVRPAQYRYHKICTDQGYVTAILAAIHYRTNPDEAMVWLVPGSEVQLAKLVHLRQPPTSWQMVGWMSGFDGDARQRLTEALHTLIAEALATYERKALATSTHQRRQGDSVPPLG